MNCPYAFDGDVYYQNYFLLVMQSYFQRYVGWAFTTIFRFDSEFDPEMATLHILFGYLQM
jgi:hypothetical protein